MLFSYLHNKNTNEDPKTSTVIGQLLMLPDDALWQILHQSCNGNEHLQKSCGKLINYDFWPHWKATDDIINTNYVEPDAYLHFELLDVIIEAKYSNYGGQYSEQWGNEVVAYFNKYKYDNPVVLLSIGGITSNEVTKVVVDGHDVKVFPCTWLSIRHAVDDYLNALPQDTSSINGLSPQRRILETLIRYFDYVGEFQYKWFDSLPAIHIPADSFDCFLMNF